LTHALFPGNDVSGTSASLRTETVTIWPE
jgi:hypothetical protein